MLTAPPVARSTSGTRLCERSTVPAGVLFGAVILLKLRRPSTPIWFRTVVPSQNEFQSPFRTSSPGMAADDVVGSASAAAARAAAHAAARWVLVMSMA